MRYEIEVDKGYKVIARNVIELDHNSAERKLSLRMQDPKTFSTFRFVTLGVISIKGGVDYEPWEKSLDVIPPDSGAPAVPDSYAGYDGGIVAADRKEPGIPAELATSTFAPLESLIAEGALTQYVPRSIPLENMV